MTGNSSLRWGFVAPQAGLLLQSLPQPTGSQGWNGPDGTPDLSRLPVFLAVRPSHDCHARDAQAHPQAIFPQPRGAGGAGGLPLGTGRVRECLRKDLASPEGLRGGKGGPKKKAAGWKRRQREGNQTRRGTKEGRAASESAGAGTGSVPEGR